MNLSDALTALGLHAEDDLAAQLPTCRQSRNRIAELTEKTQDPKLAKIYQKSLQEIDLALGLLEQHLLSNGTIPATPKQEPPPPPPAPIVQTSEAPPPIKPPPLPTRRPAPTTRLDDASPPAPAPELPADPPPTSTSSIPAFAIIFILLLGATGGALLYWKNDTARLQAIQSRVILLEKIGSIAIENRDWTAATLAFEEIESLQPQSQIAQTGLRSIEAGMNEEQTQFIGYWTGQALAELEAGRLDEATLATQQVLKKYPNHAEISSIVRLIAQKRSSQARDQLLADARSLLDARKYQETIAKAQQITTTLPNDSEALALIADATAALEKLARNKLRAAELFQQASLHEPGKFNQQALDWLREANTLDPTHPGISSLLEKLASYTRTLRVPEEVPTLQEAITLARDKDRIILSNGLFHGPISINASIDLQGSDPTTTIIECPPDAGSSITIGPDAKAARISGITFRHQTFAAGENRYSVALVRAGNANFVDCRFADGSGHGLAIIEGGHALVEQCRFSENGWNGIAVEGPGSTLEAKDSEAISNFEHGIESWNGGAVILTNNRCQANTRNGIHIDAGAASATLSGNQLIANREFGLVLTSAGSGRVINNVARDNLLGGIAIRAGSSLLPVTKNQITSNQGSGIILEHGLNSYLYADNSISKNTEPQILKTSEVSAVKSDLPPPDLLIPPQAPEP